LPGAGKLLQANGLLELAGDQVRRAELQSQAGVEKPPGFRVIAEHPVEVAGFALEHEFGTPQLKLPVIVVAIELDNVAVEPVEIGLQQAFERDRGGSGRFELDFGAAVEREGAGQAESEQGDGRSGHGGSGAGRSAESCPACMTTR